MPARVRNFPACSLHTAVGGPYTGTVAVTKPRYQHNDVDGRQYTGHTDVTSTRQKEDEEEEAGPQELVSGALMTCC